jgi:type I restriction enzyme S subunit
MVWSDELKREIPRGWKVEKLSKHLEIGSGFGFKSDAYTRGGKYTVVTIKNVQDGFLDISAAEKVDEIPDSIKDFCILKIGDALMSLTGNVGRMCLVDSENLLLNQRVGKLILNNKSYFEYFYLLLSSNEQRNRLEQISGGSSQANLSPFQAVDAFVVLPDDEITARFRAIAGSIFAQYVVNRQESARLAILRDFLLPMFMNGQISVS